MPRELVVLPRARRGIVDIADYYYEAGSPETAARWVERVFSTFQYLARNPGVGEPLDDPRPRLAGARVGRVEKFPHHVVVYRPFEGGIEVLAVTHGSRDLRRRV